ncbi:MAG: hypothetical protein M1829_002240 [Trizodia sp. TS-e1964]|nr:MAG: hypothetical protein M1829_002240 [Trizodia sp. TS-e1964]
MLLNHVAKLALFLFPLLSSASPTSRPTDHPNSLRWPMLPKPLAERDPSSAAPEGGFSKGGVPYDSNNEDPIQRINDDRGSHGRLSSSSGMPPQFIAIVQDARQSLYNAFGQIRQQGRFPRLSGNPKVDQDGPCLVFNSQLKDSKAFIVVQIKRWPLSNTPSLDEYITEDEFLDLPVTVYRGTRPLSQRVKFRDLAGIVVENHSLCLVSRWTDFNQAAQEVMQSYFKEMQLESPLTWQLDTEEKLRANGHKIFFEYNTFD